jgi:hypothetical protein
VTSLRSSGASQPGEDRTSGRPASSQTMRAFFCGQRQRHVARHGGDAQHLDLLGAGQRQQDRHRVVLTGVGVDDDLAGARLWR